MIIVSEYWILAFLIAAVVSGAGIVLTLVGIYGVLLRIAEGLTPLTRCENCGDMVALRETSKGLCLGCLDTLALQECSNLQEAE